MSKFYSNSCRLNLNISSSRKYIARCDCCWNYRWKMLKQNMKIENNIPKSPNQCQNQFDCSVFYCRVWTYEAELFLFTSCHLHWPGVTDAGLFIQSVEMLFVLRWGGIIAILPHLNTCTAGRYVVGWHDEQKCISNRLTVDKQHPMRRSFAVDFS